jgi:hypothetical protein
MTSLVRYILDFHSSDYKDYCILGAKSCRLVRSNVSDLHVASFFMLDEFFTLPMEQSGTSFSMSTCT